MSDDVAVVGGGLAGCAAALAAAERASSATVRLIRNGADLPRRANGLIGVLGYVPDVEGPVSDPLASIDALADDHPYRVLGVDALREALSAFDETVGERYAGAHTARNALVPTAAGAVAPAARYPASTAPGLLGPEDDVLFVGFRRLPAFDGPFVADALTELDVPGSFRGRTVRFPVDEPESPTARAFAAALETDRAVDRSATAGTEERTSIRDALAEAVDARRDGGERIGFPAVLGLDSHASVVAHLEDVLGVPVFEVPAGRPHVPGMRLASLLFDRLAKAGVRIVDGTARVARTSGDRIEAVTVEVGGSERTVDAAEYVLATGGVASGGIATHRDGAHEPVFDCPVEHADGREAWSTTALLGDHAFARFGLPFDDELRPTDGRGAPVYENLRAAGTVLAGFNPVVEHSRDGVALTTGHRAGVLAVEEGF